MRCHYASDSCQGLTRARATPSHSQGSLNLPMRRRPLDEQLPLGGGRPAGLARTFKFAGTGTVH